MASGSMMEHQVLSLQKELVFINEWRLAVDEKQSKMSDELKMLRDENRALKDEIKQNRKDLDGLMSSSNPSPLSTQPISSETPPTQVPPSLSIPSSESPPTQPMPSQPPPTQPPSSQPMPSQAPPTQAPPALAIPYSEAPSAPPMSLTETVDALNDRREKRFGERFGAYTNNFCFEVMTSGQSPLPPASPRPSFIIVRNCQATVWGPKCKAKFCEQSGEVITRELGMFGRIYRMCCDVRQCGEGKVKWFFCTDGKPLGGYSGDGDRVIERRQEGGGRVVYGWCVATTTTSQPMMESTFVKWRSKQENNMWMEVELGGNAGIDFCRWFGFVE